MFPEDHLMVASLQPFSTVDYPYHFSAVIFCQGCPWRCRYCHNPKLRPFIFPSPGLPWEKVLSFLSTRKTLLDGVVFSGGEPVWQPHLIKAVEEVKSLGFKVGLHTSGSSSCQLSTLLSYVDWVGFDVKNPFDQYERITQVKGSGEEAESSLRMLLEAHIPYECRTTIHPRLHSPEDILALAETLSHMGVRHYHLQHFRAHGCIDEQLILDTSPFYLEEALYAKISSWFETFSIRD